MPPRPGRGDNSAHKTSTGTPGSGSLKCYESAAKQHKTRARSARPAAPADGAPARPGVRAVSLSRSTTRSESRSSSCAQHRRRARDGHPTPSRSPTGSDCAANAAPAASGHARWTSASSVAGASSAVSRSSAVASGRGPAAPHAASCNTAPSAIASRVTPASSRARHVREVGGRDQALPAGAQQLDEPRAAAGVELAHDVVEQHQRRRPARRGERLALGQQQREQPEPLLPARAVGAQLAVVAPQHELVAVRAVAGEAALEVGLQPLRQLGGERLGRRRLRARPVARPRARPRGPSPAACSAKRGRSSSTAAARSAISAMPWRASSASHAGSEPRPARPARIAATSALRWASAALYARRVAARAGRSARDDLVEVGAAQRRRAGDELEPVGQEHRHERAARRRRSAARPRAPSTRSRFGSPGWNPTLSSCALSGVLAAQLEPRELGAEAHALALVAVRHERPVQAK